MTDDVFCKIINGELSQQSVYRDGEIIVLQDIHPQAPVHLLVMPIRHFTGIEDFTQEDAPLLGKMVLVAHQVAAEQGLINGYRIIINHGEDGGKTVPHLHLHVLGGRALGPKLVE